MSELPVIDLVVAILAIVLGAVGTYLLLPHPHGKFRTRTVHTAGLIFTTIAILLLAWFWTSPPLFLSSVFFYAFGISALVGAVLTVTSRNPVYSALWFASVVLSTSGLFLLAGAQFLAASTIIVYAGAIIVTFLFVIMLAQMEGSAAYDRSSRTPARSTFTCFLLFWGLLFAIISLRVPAEAASGIPKVMAEANRLRSTTYLMSMHNSAQGNPGINMVLQEAVRPTALIEQRLKPATPLETDPTVPHVAELGGTLFSDHLITVELAGVLLFVALVGAVAITQPRKPIRPTPGSNNA